MLISNENWFIIFLIIGFSTICSGSMTKTGSDGRVVPYPLGWMTKTGSDGRVVAYPLGWMTKTGSDGRVIAYPLGWMTKTGSDGRVVPYPSGWMTKTGSDGRVVAYPLGWMTKTGSDGRVVPYNLSNYSDLRYQILQELGNEVDGLSALKMMGYIDSEPRSYSSGNNQTNYDAGYFKATQDVQALLISEYGVTNLSDLNDAAILYGTNLGKDTVTTNPTAYNLVTQSFHEDAILNAKTEGIALGKKDGESLVSANPSAYNLVTQAAYDEMKNELMSGFVADATPYTEGWFYYPSRGWMWTNRKAYPYFYDAKDKDWMNFQSGNEKPKFYRYKTKTWLTVE
jgi:hypothetical protein